MQVDQIWEGNGQMTHALEMLSYDPSKKIYIDSGFGSDGSTWSLTATFDGATMIEQGFCCDVYLTRRSLPSSSGANATRTLPGRPTSPPSPQFV